MKILQLVQKPQRRGAEVFARQLNQELRSAGHTVSTAYLYPHQAENPLPIHDGDVVLGGREHHYLEKLPGVHPMLVWRLQQFIDKTKPDVVQLNGGQTVKYGAAASGIRRRRSWVVIYRNIGQPQDWIRGWRHKMYSALVMPNVDGVVGVSAVTLQAVQALYRLSVPAVRIPCAIDTTALVSTAARSAVRLEATTPPDAPVVVWIGSLTREKRVDRLIRVIEIAKRAIPDLHLWIVGGGPLRASLEQQVRAAGLSSCIRFLGVQHQVANFLNAADIAALTSDTEGMPAVLLEAGALGLPVVTTRVGGVAECVLDGKTGILVERNDEGAFANAIRDLVALPESRRRLGSAARSWVEQNFTMAPVARQYAAFYRQVLAA
jgi:glycosyltransferase involved in cell wall biosynthesis